MSKLINFKKIADANLEKLDLSNASKLRLKNEVKKSRMMSFKTLSFIGIPAVAALIAFILIFTGVFSPSNILRVSKKSTRLNVPNTSIFEISAKNIMKGITPQTVWTKALSNNFIKSTADFSMDLFKEAYTKGKNSLISPPSVYLALGMTANGSDGNTLKQFETLLGKYGLNIKDLNPYYKSLSSELSTIDSGKLSIGNSIWYNENDNLEINGEFLQTNADYFNGAAFKADFNNPATVNDINSWVKLNTGNTIDKIIDKIDNNSILYLINTVLFDAQWKDTYPKVTIFKDNFQLSNKTKESIDFMHSNEYWYLKDDQVEGFIKPYKNEKYSFVALLPKKNVNIDSYISSLSGESFITLLKNKSDKLVETALPKFKATYKINLVKPLKDMGLKDCFNADNLMGQRLELLQ